jgi:glycosyltransferase involved in cell wall biosynthesis
MRVLIDASALRRHQSGLRTYTLGLVSALERHGDIDVAVATSTGLSAPRVETIHVPATLERVERRAIWRERKLAGLVKAHSIDLLVAPLAELPIRRLPVPTVVVIHDVGPIVAPALYGLPRSARYWLGIRHAVQAATGVVCVSETTFLGLYAALGVDPSKCRVIGQATQLPVLPHQAPTASEPTVLYVGSAHPHKNLTTLIRALSISPPIEGKLVIAGPSTPGQRARLVRECEQFGVTDRVTFEGFVSDERMAELYSTAFALVLPSLYEGFGIPLLESFQAQVPAVVSDLPALRETGQDAALYVSRILDPRAWRDALERVLTSGSLREELVRKGTERARAFSWEFVACAFVDYFREIASQRFR